MKSGIYLISDHKGRYYKGLAAVALKNGWGTRDNKENHRCR
jgi:hypothetical protein